MIWDIHPKLRPSSEAKIAGAQSLDPVSTRIMLENGKLPVKLIKLSQVNRECGIKRHLQYIINYLDSSKGKLAGMDEWMVLSKLLQKKLK